MVYIHGFENCVENIVRDVGQPCTAGSPARSAYALAAQLDASGKNALLICPEVAFDQRSSLAGQLGVQDGFKALLAETLGKLAPTLGPVTLADVGKVLVMSHSGGDVVAEDIALKGGLPVQELILFDSLYQDVANFETWVKQDLPGLAGQTPRHRFASFYTMNGGTLGLSQTMAGQLLPLVNPAVIGQRPRHGLDLARRHLPPRPALQVQLAAARRRAALLLPARARDQQPPLPLTCSLRS